MTSPTGGGPVRPAAVLWDMDGTLVDTEPYWFAAERDLVAEFGEGDWPDEKAQQLIGFDLMDSAAFLQEHAHVDLPAREIVERLLDGVVARLQRGIPWRPGARELLAELNAAGVPCALVTMSWRSFADAVLAALPDHAFVAAITGDAVPEGEGKPHPTPYLMGAAACGADPADCVAIEDSTTGIRSASRAGCRVVAVPNQVVPEGGPDVTYVDSLDGISLADLEDLFTTGAREQVSHATSSGHHPGGAVTRQRRLLVTGGVVLALAALGLWWFTARVTDEPPLPPGAVATDVWVPYWALDQVALDGYDRLDAVRQVSPFWYEAQGADVVTISRYAPADQTGAFVAAIDRPSAIVPSILDETPAGTMAAILADPAQRATHVATIREFAGREDVAGIDIDYEKFAFSDGASTWEATRPNWVAFVTELAAALHADGRLLTVSVPGVWGLDGDGNPTEGYWVYDHAAIAEHVDAIRVMAYEFSGDAPGPVAPTYWVDDVVSTMSSIVPEEYHGKLVLGVPAYGVNWVRSAVGDCPDSAEGTVRISARNVHDLAARRGGVPQFDQTTHEWFFTYDLTVEDGDRTCVQSRYVQWVDADGVDERVRIARRAGWGGVALWALGYDDAAVWTAFTDAAVRPLEAAP